VREPRRTHSLRAAPPASRTRTRPSLGPGTRAPSWSLSLILEREETLARGSGRAARELRKGPPGTDHGAGQVRCRANRDFPEEPTTGLGRPDAARLAAHQHAAPSGDAEPDASEPGRRLRPPSTNARTRRAQAKWPYVVAVAEVVRRRRVPNTLAQRPPKRGTARVNTDLARGGRRQSTSQDVSLSEARPERKDERDPDRAVEPGRGIGEVPG
jgi:hypothetical protein